MNATELTPAAEAKAAKEAVFQADCAQEMKADRAESRVAKQAAKFLALLDIGGRGYKRLADKHTWIHKNGSHKFTPALVSAAITLADKSGRPVDVDADAFGMLIFSRRAAS